MLMKKVRVDKSDETYSDKCSKKSSDDICFIDDCFPINNITGNADISFDFILHATLLPKHRIAFPLYPKW